MQLTTSEYPVIDLKANYGQRYRVLKDACGDQFIRHKWGDIYAHSATELACFVNGRKKYNLLKAEFPDIQITQEGDQEIIFVFDPSLLPGLATALKAHKKRQMSEKERDRLIKVGREYQFPATNHGVEEGISEKSGDIVSSALPTYPENKDDELSVN